MASETPFHGKQHLNVYNMLRKLHRNTRANIPAMVAQRAMSSFSLQAEPPSREAQSMVSVIVYPQNPFVSEPEVRSMLAEDIRPELINNRVQIQDSLDIATYPDDEGNYLYLPDDPRFDQVNAFYYATFTLRMYERYAYRSLAWSFPSPRITIDPHVGDLANAFYNEQEHLLGFHNFISRDQIPRSTAQSADIIAHETAHAILDGIRDLQNESLSLGNRAFHESFADISAMLVALHDDSLIRRLLDWTDNDLRMSNFVTQVAENLARELNGGADYIDEHTVYLRNAFNNLRDRPFDALEYIPDNPVSGLSRQEHNYSRVFTGAFYDIFVRIYEHYVRENLPFFVAVCRARDIVGHLLMIAIEAGPVGELNYADMARAFLAADHILYDGTYQLLLRDVFVARNILTTETADAHIQSLSDVPHITLPQTMNNALAASRYLEEVVLPALEIDTDRDILPLSAYRNAKGYVFLNYFTSHRLLLDGEQFRDFEKAELDAFGGLTLVFKPDNHLCSVCHRPVTDEDLRQLNITVAELIEHNRIALDLHPPTMNLRPAPQGLHIPNEETPDDHSKIVKYPVIFDAIPLRPVHLDEYLRQIQADS
jgi:hypothetical protein